MVAMPSQTLGSLENLMFSKGVMWPASGSGPSSKRSLGRLIREDTEVPWIKKIKVASQQQSLYNCSLCFASFTKNVQVRALYVLPLFSNGKPMTFDSSCKKIVIT